MFLKMRKCTWCKVLAFSLSFLVLVVPFCAISANAESDVFCVQYFDPMTGDTVISPDFGELPTSVFTASGTVALKDWIIVKGYNAEMQEQYFLYMFAEDTKPSSYNVKYSVFYDDNSIDSYCDKMYGSMTDAQHREWFEAEMKDLYWHNDGVVPTAALGYVLVRNFVYNLGLWRPDTNIGHSESWWRQQFLENVDVKKDFYYAARDCGIRPWIDIEIKYDSGFQKPILYYMDRNGSWQWVNSFQPSGAYYFNIVGATAICGSSFDGTGSLVMNGSADSFVDHIKDAIEEEGYVDKPNSSPSWDSVLPDVDSGSNGSGSVGDSFLSGSWYNDGGTGNPFVAAFVAPWIGVNWTYENVFTEISLFGVTAADMIATALVVLASAILVTWLVKAVKG